ncbi:hypothetical protein OSTOST_16241, partial [Ostertagia ostertagi]
MGCTCGQCERIGDRIFQSAVMNNYATILQCFKSRHVSSVGVCCLTSMDTDAGRPEKPRDFDESHSCATKNCPLGSDCFRGACFPKKGLICSSAMDAGRRCTTSPASVSVALLTTGEPLQCSSDDDCNGGFCRFNSAIMTRICCTN